MKIFTTILLLSFSYNVCAQKSIFVRVYDLAGIKIHKGHVLSVTDTSLHLKESRRAVIIPVQNIGLIKTRRSAGHNVLLGSLIGLTVGAIVVAASSSSSGYWDYSAGEGAAGGAVAGLVIGAGVSALTIPLKGSTSFMIDGDMVKWKTFQKIANGNRSE